MYRKKLIKSAVALVVISVAGCTSSADQVAESTTSAIKASPESQTASPPAGSTDPSSAKSTETTSASRSSSTSELSRPSKAVPSVMPDYTGTPYEEAFADLATFNVKVTKKLEISPAAAGTVISQDPIAGSSFSQSVSLTVSTAPPKVPDVSGQTFGTAEQSLTALGFKVTEKPIFDDQRADGLVVGQDPAAGAENQSEVALSVVRQAIVVYLSDMEVVSAQQVTGPSTGTQKSNGVNYTHGVKVTPYSNGVGSVEYDLSREYRQLVGAVGLDDKAASDTQVQMEIYGDGRLLRTEMLTLGATIPVDIDVTNVLRLKIAMSAVNGSGAVILGDLRLQGLPSEVSTTTTPTS